MALSFKRIWEGLNLKPKSSTTASAQGDLEVLSSDTKLHYHNGTTNSPVVTEDHTATLENKTIVAIDNNIVTAASGNLTATELNAALAELQADIDTKSSNITVKDEGSNITTAVSSFDFVGAGVTATNIGNAVTVTVTGGGDVVGPASSVDSEIALFDGVTGKLLKRATGSGIVKSVSGVYTPQALVGLSDGGTNKNMTAVAGGIVWTDADSMEVTAAGTSGQILQSNGTSAPSWVSVSSVSKIEVFNDTLALNGSSSSVTGVLHFKAPQALTINTVILQLFEKNGVSSGNLEIDLKVNTTPNDTGMTTIFTTKPILDFATAADYDTNSGTLSTSSVASGSYIRLDVTQIPSGFVGYAQVVVYA